MRKNAKGFRELGGQYPYRSCSGEFDPGPVIGPVTEIFCYLTFRNTIQVVLTHVSQKRVNLIQRALCTVAAVLLCLSLPSAADLRNAPNWFDPDGVANGDDWHYRVPINLPNTAGRASTIKLDVNFNQLLGDLGVNPGSVNFDENSPRIVTSTGTIATQQEFTDQVFGGLLDSTNNGRGEIKFILQHAPSSGPYYLYFDIVENGAKSPNPQQTINGNFEHSNGTVATGWTTSSVNTGGNQSNLVQTTTLGNTINLPGQCNSNATNNIDNSPNNNGVTATGVDWYLLGFRNNCEDGGGGVERVQLNRSLQNPNGAARGNLTFFFQVQTYDGLTTNSNNYDYFRMLVNGAVVDHTTLSINNATAPTLRIRNIGIGRPGYASNLVDFGWKQATLNMAQFPAGATTLRIETLHSGSDENYKSWVKLDDFEWAVQTGTLGAAQGFGKNIIAPADTAASPATTFGPNQILTIVATSNAQANSVIASVIDQNGTTVSSNIMLFDDGTHGDVTANDGSWANDGSDAAFPTYTFTASDPSGTNWSVNVQGLDNSTSNIGATNGLLHINGQPDTPPTQANFWNIDSQVFTFATPQLSISKLSFVISDPYNGTSNPKRIPGAIVEYRLAISNTGSGTVDNGSLLLTDAVPPNTALCVSATCSGVADPIVFDASGSPVPTGLTFNYASNVTFSVDGTDFSYLPVPDLEGFDDAVTHVRIIPGGIFAGGVASFDLRLFARVD